MKVNFYLKRKTSKTETAIIMMISYNAIRLKIYTPLTAHPSKWNYNQMVFKSNSSGATDNNTRLRNYAAGTLNVYRNFLMEHDEAEPTPEQLKKLIVQELWPKTNKKEQPGQSTDFIKFFENHLQELKTRKAVKSGEQVKESTIQTRRQTLNILKEFKPKIPFNTLDAGFYKDLSKFLEKRYSTNTVGKHKRIIRTVLMEAKEVHHDVFISSKFNATYQQTPEIYLTADELYLIEQLKLTDNRLAQIRDMFLIGCHTGLRFSDLIALQPENFDGDFIKIKQTKTGGAVNIPILSTTRRILNKYNSIAEIYRPHNAVFNREIKTICKLVPELNKPTRYIDNSISIKNKWELVKSHTMRRTFCTVQYNSGLDIKTIMAISGHKTEKDFFRYLRMPNREAALEMMAHDKQQNNERNAV